MGGMATWAIFLKFPFYKMLCQVDKRWAGELRRDSWRREAVRLGWAPLCWQAEFLVLHGWSRSGLLVRVTCIRIWSERWHASLLMSRITMVFVEWNFFFFKHLPFWQIRFFMLIGCGSISGSVTRGNCSGSPSGFRFHWHVGHKHDDCRSRLLSIRCVPGFMSVVSSS